MNRILVIILILGLTLAGCIDVSASKQEMADAKTVNKQQEQYATVQPIPFFDYSRERGVYIQIYQARNKAVATHTVWRGDMSIIEGDCPSIGFPIPYDVQLTNPAKIAMQNFGNGNWKDGIVEQAEPNGLFSSKNTTASWVMCVVKDQGVSRATPVYIEGKVTTYPYPVVVDYDKNRVYKADGAVPSVVITENK